MEAILMLRIYAMYGATRTIGGLCAILFLGEMASFIILFSVRRKGDIFSENNPAPGVFICVAGGPDDGPHFIAAYQWMILIGIEAVLVALAVYKRWENRGLYNGGLMKVLTTGSMVYFVVILIVYAVNQAIWLMDNVRTFRPFYKWCSWNTMPYMPQNVLNETGSCLAHAIAPVLANRLMVAVRKHYYRQHGQQSVHTVLGVHFALGATSLTQIDTPHETDMDAGGEGRADINHAFETVDF
ncbi:hypothetical protein NM688_g6804 [Phlebia brevispora]|uniref:Uncharacterized protein n=1 Tax=Phlebia brevispora TaxID=194682 RepID=A0ACC1SCI2_9APHY|nr:hypothetical protein NM688_g6804 [Phlebia brevispora]